MQGNHVARRRPAVRLFAQYARAREEVIPVSADGKLVMPSFRIEMRDGSPQSRPAESPAAAAVDYLTKEAVKLGISISSLLGRIDFRNDGLPEHEQRRY
jgi:hypothetical protein